MEFNWATYMFGCMTGFAVAIGICFTIFLRVGLGAVKKRGS